ncbi:hypothetical protein ACE193_05210 [Bernardetia sp. OM2101]|uniref:hypothetical protein n=1 Tax=Bernardetia sp. OM2101 TaxID=3344876 RepID=UPI0035CF51D5
MDLYFEIKRRFQKATIIELDTEPSIFEVQFKNAVDSVFIALKDKDRFTVSYPILKQDYKNNLKLSNQTSSDILLTGVIWILSQIEENGKVIPEFM